MASSRVGGAERVLSKCQSCIDEGNFYEAHQMYRTLSFRYKGQNKYAEAINLLYEGAYKLLQYNQHTSGADLALLLIDLLNTSLSPVTDDIIEKNYVQARYHLIHSTDGTNCAAMLIEHHVTKGYQSEADLFIAQAVLQYLCLQNKDTAQVVFNTYTKNHPDVEDGPPFYKPLLNFIWFLLLALEGGKVTVFTILCEKYQTSIKRDPTYREYLDRIGQLFFGLPPPKTQPQGMFGNLLQSLMGAGNDDDEDIMQQSTSSSQMSLSQVDLD
ncbi:hypothetical protein KUTeg_003992 [Tegillarca granosa]|uniref:Golgi to ER traffic protein 4 homolog n=1 Tax=Tegillarca granosa TaxID=220873 RepID=A0ABQ9FQC0_TEGGR|nr:hypothetical protein KUTeg_003992 [Tegillarca granosa]